MRIVTYDDKIILKGLEFFAKHGVWDHEKEFGQKFNIDAELFGDFRTAGLSDRLEDAVDYTAVYRSISRVMSSGPYDLIEALAEAIASAILSGYPAIKSVKIKVDKPGASLGGVSCSVGVEIMRSR